MRKFKFETGEIIECNDEAIIKLLLEDKRYSEVTNDKGKGEKAHEKVQKQEYR